MDPSQEKGRQINCKELTLADTQRFDELKQMLGMPAGELASQLLRLGMQHVAEMPTDPRVAQLAKVIRNGGAVTTMIELCADRWGMNPGESLELIRKASAWHVFLTRFGRQG